MSTTLSEETATDSTTPAEAEQESAGGFRLALQNFNGPFDVLLHLITKRELDITEVALAEVTDEFIAYLRELQASSAADGSDGMKVLDETTEFLVVASTLLDLKAARLLPRGEMADEEDFELLEARDLLFARLLQYKAFKQAAEFLGERYMSEGARHPREVSLEPQFAALLPELVFNIGPDVLSAMAAKALAPKPEPATEVGIGHLHGANVTIAEEAETITAMLESRGTLAFTQLVADADGQLVVVVRFLALLEMFRQKAISFAQEDPLGPLLISLIQESSFDAQAVQDDYEGSSGEVNHE
ncbi:segregation and condensation protein A [Glutamicibacter arilaitensis]|uniref:Segregation and condensation protein A n=1 Tax=Glutamicibacter arilaitensis TaxID=256701 RepID=A0A4Y8TZJ4_9MICC|nr:segregation/condensation protein A [Glutamicibacter arilaitensis]TFH57646.1 segregation/condensation protein A [Glutamicibacter arilaitensis]